MGDNLFEDKSEEDLGLHTENERPKDSRYLVKQYAPLVKYVAGKVAMGMPHNFEFDDLVGFDIFGLFDAIIVRSRKTGKIQDLRCDGIRGNFR
jgi:RNA polymerase sigma factor for flagellar operon FliA